MSVLYYTNFESSLEYKTVYNFAMPYLVALMMTGPKFLEDLENNQINLWPERNPMALDRIIIEILNK